MKKKELDLSEFQNSYQFPFIAVMTILWIFFMIMYIQTVDRIGKSSAAKVEKLAEAVREDLKEIGRAHVWTPVTLI